MGVRVRSRFENQPRNKHVESNSVTCLDGGSNPPSSTNPTHDSHRLWTAVVGRADGEPRIRPAPLGKRTFPTKDTDNQRDCRCFFALWKFQVSEPRLRRLHQDAPSQNSCRNLLTILHISSTIIHQGSVRRGWRGMDRKCSKSETCFFSTETDFSLYNLLSYFISLVFHSVLLGCVPVINNLPMTTVVWSDTAYYAIFF